MALGTDEGRALAVLLKLQDGEAAVQVVKRWLAGPAFLGPSSRRKQPYICFWWDAPEITALARTGLVEEHPRGSACPLGTECIWNNSSFQRALNLAPWRLSAKGNVFFGLEADA